MADVDITYGCGCGFKTRRLEAAVEHSDDKHHSMTVLGTIKPASRAIEPQTTKNQFETGLHETPGVSRIQELRQKLNGR